MKTTQGSEELYRAYSSQDGKTWVRGGVWTHQLGRTARIGLVAMNEDTTGQTEPATVYFDYVRVSRLKG